MPDRTDPDLDPRVSDTQRACRAITADMSDKQITAPLMGGQRINVTVQLGTAHADAVQVWGGVSAVSYNSAREIFSIEMTERAEVHDGRLRQVMLDLAQQHTDSDDPAVRAVLADVIKRLETVQKLDRATAPEEWKEL